MEQNRFYHLVSRLARTSDESAAWFAVSGESVAVQFQVMQILEALWQ